MSLRQNSRCDLPKHQALSYQSECHCAKTCIRRFYVASCLVTSQNVTAPKPLIGVALNVPSLVTSQNVTAPKLLRCICRHAHCLVTSQNVTAPKPLWVYLADILCLVTSQNVTAPKHRGHTRM